MNRLVTPANCATKRIECKSITPTTKDQDTTQLIAMQVQDLVAQLGAIDTQGASS